MQTIKKHDMMMKIKMKNSKKRGKKCLNGPRNHARYDGDEN